MRLPVNEQSSLKFLNEVLYFSTQWLRTYFIVHIAWYLVIVLNYFNLHFKTISCWQREIAFLSFGLTANKIAKTSMNSVMCM